MIYRSESFKQTKKFAVEMAKALRPFEMPQGKQAQGKKFKDKQSLIIALKGNLGSGKTTFVQGFLRGLGVKKKITSPTFVIAKRYTLHATRYKSVYHIDCYRIRKSQELLILGIKEIFDNPKNIVLIEWPERIKNILPKEKITINFKYGKEQHERKIVIK